MSDTNDDRVALAWSAFLADEHSVAFRLFLRLALDGSAEAQRQVGLMHDQGKGVRQDHAQAARWYRTAADQGDAHAQHSLAVCYLIGEGLERDPAHASRWFRRAAQQGHEGSQCELGLLYESARVFLRTPGVRCIGIRSGRGPGDAGGRGAV